MSDPDAVAREEHAGRSVGDGGLGEAGEVVFDPQLHRVLAGFGSRDVEGTSAHDHARDVVEVEIAERVDVESQVVEAARVESGGPTHRLVLGADSLDLGSC